MSDLKICFLQVDSDEIKEYSKYTKPLNKQYAVKHNYDYLERKAVNLKDYSASWSKIFHSVDILEQNNYDYLFYLDADAVVLNKDIKLEDIIQDMKTDICFSENGWNGGELINAGSFIVSKEGVQILKDLLDKVENHPEYKKQFPWEQSIVNKIYNKNNMDVFPMNKINSYWLYDVNSNDDQFIYHFMARPLSEKIKISEELFKKYY